MLGLVYLSEKESLTFLTGQAHFVHKWSRLNGSMVVVVVIVVIVIVVVVIVGSRCVCVGVVTSACICIVVNVCGHIATSECVCIAASERVHIDFVRGGVIGFIGIVYVLIHKVSDIFIQYSEDVPDGLNEARFSQHTTGCKVCSCCGELVEFLVNLQHLWESCMFIGPAPWTFYCGNVL